VDLWVCAIAFAAPGTLRPFNIYFQAIMILSGVIGYSLIRFPVAL
jgi:hypothetical protein